MEKYCVIIQARMSSTRLPGKIMKEVLGKPLLEYQLERLGYCESVDEIVVATTNNPADDVIVSFCKENGYRVFRGSEDDVLSRYYCTSIEVEADHIIRITSDCPLIDPQVVDKVVESYKKNREQFNLVSNTVKRTFPRGLDVSVFSVKTLKEAFELASKPLDREHVTKYIYENNYKVLGFENDQDLSNHRWTVDTYEDFLLVKNVIESLYPIKNNFDLYDVIKFLNCNKEIYELNVHVEQKRG
ncbi:glycosyltransferase family protein [Halobacillus litoralis]|uniref:cytidylyltransferase domain-containing protein n=1 Tax=Halobacillus litoralis TaxID=45668 RepID=UPI001CD69421|nr:glycosyltransferase family protein [Halobacillus litoralis]MCA0971582.1 glycosyltransferase family protein [Halobacillus litoralis]